MNEGQAYESTHNVYMSAFSHTQKQNSSKSAHYRLYKAMTQVYG